MSHELIEIWPSFQVLASSIIEPLVHISSIQGFVLPWKWLVSLVRSCQVLSGCQQFGQGEWHHIFQCQGRMHATYFQAFQVTQLQSLGNHLAFKWHWLTLAQVDLTIPQAILLSMWRRRAAGNVNVAYLIEAEAKMSRSHPNSWSFSMFSAIPMLFQYDPWQHLCRSWRVPKVLRVVSSTTSVGHCGFATFCNNMLELQVLLLISLISLMSLKIKGCQSP
jgi:hypothetical protein